VELYHVCLVLDHWQDYCAVPVELYRASETLAEVGPLAGGDAAEAGRYHHQCRCWC
jgi:hypothetical protein